ncbi:MAG: DUF4340 domain-containing protein [Coprococcus sp.]
MEKQKKQFIIIIIILVALIAAFLGMKSYNEAKEEEKAKKESEEEIHIVDCAVEDITAFSYQINDETISLKKDGENWIYEQDDTIDIDESMVENMLSDTVALTAADAFEQEESLEEYGLSAPANEIVLKTETKEITLYLGNYNSLVDSYYLKTSESDKIYLVDSTLSTQFSKTIDNITCVEEESESDSSEDADNIK